MRSAVAKSILSQLFVSRIGNISLYRQLSDAYTRCRQTVDEDQLVDVLWETMGSVLPACLKGARETVLVVDGVDEASCGQSALVQRLASATGHVSNMKVIILGTEKPAGGPDQSVVQVTSEQEFDDIAAVVRRVLKSTPSFDAMSPEERELCVTRIVKAADGSFLWAKLASKKVRDEAPSGAQALGKAIGELAKADLTVNDLVAHALKSNVHRDGQKIIGWLATAARPLTTWELWALLSIQLQKGTVSDQRSSPLELLKPLASLVFYQNNLVYLRHGRIRSALLGVSSDKEFKTGARDTHIDLIQRLSLYIKQSVTGKDDVSLDPIDSQYTSTLLGRYPLLDFALRYWLGHTRMVFDCDSEKGIKNATKELRPFLPKSPTVALVESRLWSNKSTAVLRLLHSTQVQLFQQALGSKHPATMQAMLCQALFYKGIQTVQPTVASQIFYDTAMTCQQVLSTQHIITMQATQFFLELTSSQMTSSRTEIMLKRVEMLRLLVECYKIHYGNTSDMVTSTLYQLAGHYTSINETQEAHRLITFLQGGPTDTVAHGTVLVLDEVEQDEVISTSFDFHALIALAEKYVHEGNISAADQTYVDLWLQVSKAFRLQQSIEWELRSLHLVQAYSQFLLSQHRESEVASLLSSFWAEHKETISSYEEVVTQFMSVAQIMRTVKLSWMALEVYKQSSQHIRLQSSLYKEIREHIQATFKEFKHTEASYTSTMSESELIEMVFEESVNSSFTITATHSLVQRYLSQHRWREATKALKRIMKATWPSFFSLAIYDVRLPAKDVQFYIELAQQLRDCYMYRRYTTKEEDVCLRLYQVLRRDRSVEDKLLQSATQRLIQFYERTRQSNKLVSMHVAVLNDYSSRFGQDHPVVLQQLWILAELTSLEPAAVGYYRQIFDIINKDSDVCAGRAFEPLVILVTELIKQARYTEALRPCQILFNTLQHTRVSIKLKEQAFVRSVYERYILCLQMTYADMRLIHDITLQYRKTCLAGFKEFEPEAIELFEGLLQVQSTEIDIDYDNTRISLEAIYEGRQTVEHEWHALSTQQFHRLITARIERLSSFRETNGWAHESSISQMEEVVSMYAYQKETQAARTLLQESAIRIAFSEESSAQQITAASSIVACYRRIGQQIVTKEKTNISSVGFNLSSSGHHSLLFLAQLEYSLREREESLLTMAEIYSSLVAEYQYFERFRKEIHSQSSTLQSVLGLLSHLRGLLLARGHSTTSARLVEQFTDYFMSSHGRKLELQRNQGSILVSTILDYFQSHSSQNFLRSIALASYSRVVQLLHPWDADRNRVVCDLAVSTFRYVRGQDGFSSIAAVKLLFKTGLAISSWALNMRQTPESDQLLQVSATIVKDILGYCRTKDIDLTQPDALNLNNLLKILDREKDYQNLAWLLTALWEKRQKSRDTRPDDSYTLALGRRLTMTLYQVGDHAASIRLAEDMVYNCARVHGPRHSSTLEMTVLLSQMYTSVAQGYQETADHRELAKQYYKRAAALHENALRAFVDPSSVPTAIDADTEHGPSSPSSPSPSSGASSPDEPGQASGKSVRQHLHLLKLAIERLGNWPKGYAEYEQLNSDVFRMFRADLEGIKGLDQCNLKQFGAGRAEASDDLISSSSLPQMDLNQLAIAV
ncbi:hypothetical protein BJY04DRAFT_219787 [Aspergillus karnatakaensis]|uniref:uncharacterized protein n=1 Tax=Aspergillus karnatakaensis TaxID=1810916 RepID=UPI003CCD08A5